MSGWVEQYLDALRARDEREKAAIDVYRQCKCHLDAQDFWFSPLMVLQAPSYRINGPNYNERRARGPQKMSQSRPTLRHHRSWAEA